MRRLPTLAAQCLAFFLLWPQPVATNSPTVTGGGSGGLEVEKKAEEKAEGGEGMEEVEWKREKCRVE